MMNQALERQQQRTGLELATTNERSSLTKLTMRELRELATVMVESGAFPDIKSAAQAQIKIIAGAELGFSPIVSMTGIHFFQGKVSIGANLVASLIKDSGKYEYKILQHTDQICEIAFYQHIGSDLKSLGAAVRYTWADAQRAGLTGKDNWKKYPMDMLFAACIRQGSRRYCADIFRGTAPDHDEPDVVDVETSSMDDAAAQNVTVDGEIIEPADINELPTEAPPDPDPIDESPTADPEESAYETLFQSVKERLNGMTSRESQSILNGRKISTFDLKALAAFNEELDKFGADK